MEGPQIGRPLATVDTVVAIKGQAPGLSGVRAPSRPRLGQATNVAVGLPPPEDDPVREDVTAVGPTPVPGLGLATTSRRGTPRPTGTLPAVLLEGLPLLGLVEGGLLVANGPVGPPLAVTPVDRPLAVAVPAQVTSVDVSHGQGRHTVAGRVAPRVDGDATSGVAPVVAATTPATPVGRAEEPSPPFRVGPALGLLAVAAALALVASGVVNRPDAGALAPPVRRRSRPFAVVTTGILLAPATAPVPPLPRPSGLTLVSPP